MEELLRAHTPLAAIVDEAYTHPLLFQPGTRYSYSDYGCALAARVAEAATGRPFPELVRTLVLDPADLRDTFFPPSLGVSDRLARVVGALAEGTDGAMYNSPYALALAHPAFGVVASARDLLRFGQVFAPDGPRRILSEATIRVMTTDQTADLPADGPRTIYPHVPERYGIGFGVSGLVGAPGSDLLSPEAFGHDGASGCILLTDPRFGLTLALTSNRHARSGRDRWVYRLSAVVNGVLAALTTRLPAPASS
jgi:CubicO group peptidase (beta-lactamase class C family)